MCIDDLRREPRGDPFECFHVTAHNLLDLDASQLEYGRFDTSSIPGFAIAIDAAPLPPPRSPDYVTYLVSVSGPIFPSPTCSTAVEYLNDDTVSAYFGSHAQGLPTRPYIERTITHTFVHTKPDGSFINPTSPTTPILTPSTAPPDVQVFKYKPVAKKVRPVAATLPEEFRATRQITGDPQIGRASCRERVCLAV